MRGRSNISFGSGGGTPTGQFTFNLESCPMDVVKVTDTKGNYLGSFTCGEDSIAYDCTLNVPEGTEVIMTSTIAKDTEDVSKSYLKKFTLTHSLEEYIPLIPAMTSNTTPSGVITASSYASPGYPWRGFNGKESGDYWTANGVTNEWICYELPEPKQVNRIDFKFASVNRYATALIVQISNDGTNWLDVHSWNPEKTLSVQGANFENTASCKFIRLYVPATEKGYGVQISGIQYYSEIQTIKIMPNNSVYWFGNNNIVNGFNKVRGSYSYNTNSINVGQNSALYSIDQFDCTNLTKLRGIGKGSDTYIAVAPNNNSTPYYGYFDSNNSSIIVNIASSIWSFAFGSSSVGTIYAAWFE